MPLEVQSQSSPDEVSPHRMLNVGDVVDRDSSGGSATLTVITNQDIDFSNEDQENKEPSPMNWDNLNRILRDIELELQQKDTGLLNFPKQQVTKPVSPQSHEKEMLPAWSSTQYDINPTSCQNPHILKKNSKKKEMKDTMKDTYSPTDDVVSDLAVRESQTNGIANNKLTSSSLTMTTTQPQCDATSTSPQSTPGNHHTEIHRENLNTKNSRLECFSDKSGGDAAVKTTNDFMITSEEVEDKERAVNALIKRMFEELAAEMVEEIRLDQKGTCNDTKDISAATREEIKNYDDDNDDKDGGEKEIVDSEVRDPSESTYGDCAVFTSEFIRHENEEEAISHIREQISAVNDDDDDEDDDDDVSIQANEVDADEQRDAEDSEERTRKALENTALAAAAELERRRKEDEHVQRQQAEEKKRILADEQQRKEQISLVTTIIHANCGNEKNAYYKVLGVSPTCSNGIIKKAYRKLALKLHPDKEKYNTPKADEAFKAVSHAYDVLKDEALRNEYDRTQNRNHDTADVSAPMPNNGPVIPIIIPSGSRITIQSKDIRFAHFNGLQGCVVSYDESTELYTIQIDEHCTTMKSKITALFRNVIVCLRAAKANELGVFVVTLVSYYRDDRGGLYQARYSSEGGKRGSVYLRSEQFIIPNGTVVGLQCGNYGTIVDWRETIDQYTRADVSYYKVQLYNDIFTRVPMKNIRL